MLLQIFVMGVVGVSALDTVLILIFPPPKVGISGFVFRPVMHCRVWMSFRDHCIRGSLCKHVTLSTLQPPVRAVSGIGSKFDLGRSFWLTKSGYVFFHPKLDHYLRNHRRLFNLFPPLSFISLDFS